MESSGLHVGKRSEPTHHSDRESLFALSGKCHFFAMSVPPCLWKGMVSADTKPTTFLPALPL